uniref:Uncharacterized protein n=1 Tax=Rhizophora mucronata TaxID=61149 RepID=A0A2P2MXM7_RHIMU
MFTNCSIKLFSQTPSPLTVLCSTLYARISHCKPLSHSKSTFGWVLWATLMKLPLPWRSKLVAENYCPVHKFMALLLLLDSLHVLLFVIR